jgi:hypothetical protein
MGTTSTASFPRTDEVGQDARRLDKIGRGALEQGLAKAEDALARRRRRADDADLLRLKPVHQRRVRLAAVGLVEGHHDGDAAPPQLREDAVLDLAPDARLRHQHAEVGAVEDLLRLLHAQRAQRARVVDARRVDEQHRTQRQEFHRLLDGVGRRAGGVGDNRHFLPGDGIQQRGFAYVAPPEDPDVQPERFGCARHHFVHPPFDRWHPQTCLGVLRKSQ